MGTQLETEGNRGRLRRLANCLHQFGVRVGVLQLDGLDLADVQEISRVLGAGPRFRKGRLLHQLQGLLVQAVRQVAAQQQVQQSRLAHGVVPQACRAVGGLQLGAYLGEAASLLVGEREVEVCPRREQVQRRPVERLQPNHQSVHALEGLGLLLLVEEAQEQLEHRERFDFWRQGLLDLRQLRVQSLLHVRVLVLLLRGHLHVARRGHQRNVECLGGVALVHAVLQKNLEHLWHHCAPCVRKSPNHTPHRPRFARCHARADRAESLAQLLNKEGLRVLWRFLFLFFLGPIVIILVGTRIFRFHVLGFFLVLWHACSGSLGA
mmetsp:Transcript_87745/g.248519  ORF Transcript_87745/g.248519 Transcript_87745/m.248519 type:complete len:321 (-) Transcript_87745:91-1053(-)